MTLENNSTSLSHNPTQKEKQIFFQKTQMDKTLANPLIVIEKRRTHQTKNAVLCLDTFISSCYKTVVGMGFHSLIAFPKNINDQVG